MKQIAKLDLDGYAIGGLAVGEPPRICTKLFRRSSPLLPDDKIRYLMGVGTPANILESVERGVDLFRLRHAEQKCTPRPPFHQKAAL